MKKSRLLSLLLTVLLMAGIMAAGTSTASAGDAEKVFYTYETVECPILNGHDSVESVLQTPHDYCSSPLYRLYPNEAGNGYVYLPDLAADQPTQVDENTWHIPIRQDAVWHNGEPINADTFMYSFEMLLDPILANQIANFLAEGIFNGMEYMTQGTSEALTWEDVGIKKVDDYTIAITTVNPATSPDTICNMFLDRSTFPVYEPYYEAGMNESRTQTTYGTTLDNWMGCGPYTFKTWEFGNIHVYEKNPDHWLADKFNYDRVEVRIVPEANALVELWEKGLLDRYIPDTNTIETYIDDPRTAVYDSLSVYHIDINCKNPNNPITDTLEYRKALYHAMNREVLAQNVFGYMLPSGTYVNGLAGIFGENALTYRNSAQGQAVTDMVENWGPYGYNVELAREYLAKAYEVAGIPEDTVITLIMAVDGDAVWTATAEYLQEEFVDIFEGKIQIDIVSHSGLSATAFKQTGDDKWDLSPNEWTRGFSREYPYTCFSYYISSYGSSPNNYFVDAFDEQYAVCDAPEIKNNYMQILEETKKLEEIYLEYVIHVPIVQKIYYELFSERLILPVTTYVPALGWGQMFGDIAQ